MKKHYYALVNADNLVENVVVGDEDYPSNYPADAGKQWIETFAAGENGKNYAGVGDSYGEKPYPSWVKSGNKWVAPVALPDDSGNWIWNEGTQAWDAWAGLPQE